MAERRTKRNGSLPDVIASAADLFGAPRRGDSIVIFAGNDRLGEGKEKYQKLYESLVNRRIRVFGILLSAYFAGDMLAQVAWSGSPFLPDDKTIHSLTWGSGGYYREETTDYPTPTYRLTDERLLAMTTLAQQIYGAIAEFYRLQIDFPYPLPKNKSWKLDLSPNIPNEQNRHVLYPRQVPSCELH